LEDTMRRNRIVVCTNVSFVPQCWNNHAHIRTSDVGLLARQMLERASREREERIKAQNNSAENQAARDGKSTFEEGAAAKVVVPETLMTTYRATRDWLF